MKIKRSKKTGKILVGSLRKFLKGRTKMFSVNAAMEVWRKHPRCKSFQFFAVDAAFHAFDEESLKYFLEYSQVDKLKYIPEVRDCDDMALILKAEATRKFAMNNFLIILDNCIQHAYSGVFIHKNGKLELRLIEPQDDRELKNFPKKGCGIGYF